MNFEKMVNALGILIEEKELKQFDSYKNILLEWSAKVNLTAIVDKDEIDLKHFVDSLTIHSYIKPCAKVIDVGTGAGFPGIPLKIVRKDIDVTLLDSLQKRVNFLNEVITLLALEKTIAVHARAEDAGKDEKYREKFDIATARAVANLASLAEYCLPFVKIGGYFIAMKGNNVEEIGSAKKAITELGGEISKVEKMVLPNSDIERNIILVKKITHTPKIYPRKAGTPLKRPII